MEFLRKCFSSLFGPKQPEVTWKVTAIEKKDGHVEIVTLTSSRGESQLMYRSREKYWYYLPEMKAVPWQEEGVFIKRRREFLDKQEFEKIKSAFASTVPAPSPASEIKPVETPTYTLDPLPARKRSNS